MGDNVTTTTRAARVGDVVLVVVPRGTNAGLDHAPAVVTRVKPKGFVDLQAFVGEGQPSRIVGARLLADREAANKLLEFHFADLPGGRHVHDDNGDLVQEPGKNSLTGEPWHRSDVAHWVRVAYWPAEAGEVVEEPAVESDADAIARLRRELAAARGEE